MPELPEVETIKRVIEPQMKGREISDIIVNRTDVIAYPKPEEFCGRLTGQRITGMARRGKFIMILLESGDRVILHLRMTGCLLITPRDYPQEKHTHIIFRLSSGDELRFSDPRRFGRFWLIKNHEEDTYSGIAKSGLEPFDEAFNTDYLRQSLGKRKKAIKGCLLDQNIVAGIGNIYSDEILFRAGICPSRPANSLMSEEWERLAEVIPQCLSFFIEKNAITPEEYLKTKGREYRNTPFLQVYGHGGGTCPVCGDTLCKIVIGGRSSVYCPTCQGDG